MKTTWPLLLHLPLRRVFGLLLALALALATAFTTGCGSSSSQSTGLSGNTSVTVLLTSTANDQLSLFLIGLNSLALTSQSGKTVNLFTTSQTTAAYFSGRAEFIHLNGTAEPLVTVSVPQDVYTSATATMSTTISNPPQFICVTVGPSGGLVTSSYAYAEPSTPTVNVPAPITITGRAMGLSLNMVVSQSETLSGCGVGATFSITPVFNLTPVALSPQPTNYENGKETNLDGQISSVNTASNSFTLVLVDGQTLSVNSNGSTVYQGVNGFSALTAGTFVDMDAAIQSDGSQLATRIAVEDTDTANLSVATGPVLQTSAAEPIVATFGRQEQGYLSTIQEAALLMPYDSGNAVFQISGQFTNLPDLPFPASFDAANIFGGQNVYITTHALNYIEYMPATTITLMPQTINGTVGGASSSGGFQIYSVALASYDLPPILATQPAQSYTLNNPTNVMVYVDSNTQLLNKQPLAQGSVFRFNGLLFNDDGTMRMDCGEVMDGVQP
jgi:hypothetical protein